jgi:capsular exopolysaccharide synthesis family protein
VDQFAQQTYEQHLEAVESVNRLLVKDEARLRQKVDEAARALQAYRQSRGSVSLEGGQDIVVQTMKDLSAKLTDASAERDRLESEFKQVQAVGQNIPALLTIRSVANDATVANCLIQVAQAEVDLGNVKQTKLPLHPKYIEAIGKLVQWQTHLTNSVLQATHTLANSFESAKKNEESLLLRLRAQTEEVFKLEKESVEYNILLREAKANHDMYDTVLNRLKETTISKDWNQNKMTVVQPAYAAEKPIRPDRKRIMMLGLMVGLGVGLALALGLEVIDSSIKTPDQAEALLGLPILTAVPRLRSVETGRKHVVMSENGEGHGAEAFRTLRTSLSMLGAEGTRRTFLFTSAVPEEGKTFCALNFAYSLAQQGLRTLLIEADLRCPSVEGALPFAVNSSPGLTDYLTNQNNFEAIVQPSDTPNLSVVLAGTRSPNPSELLGQDGFSALIQEALLHFDRVVVDSAPVQPVSDTLLLVAKVQTVCLVVCADRAPRKAAQRAVQMLQKNDAPVAGVIFNRLSQTRGQHYYDYSYYPEYVDRGVVKT